MRTVSTFCLVLALPVLAAGAARAQSDTSPASLSIADFLTRVEGRLLDVREIELRQIESREKVRHLDRSRAFELEVDGVYQEADLDRLEVNGDNRKTGRLRQVDRELSFALTHPILGRSLEDRLMVALEEQRQVELEFEAEVVRRSSLLEAIDLYLLIYEAQESIRLLRQAVEIESERERILAARGARGESLRRDVLAATADLAARRLALVSAERRVSIMVSELAERVTGEPLAPFRAEPLAWERLAERLDALSADGQAAVEVDAMVQPAGGASPVTESGFWHLCYNVPEIDLTLAYTIESLDRIFADEKRRERGHSPEIQLTFELPLDFYRSARAFQRQVAARQERRQLNLLVMERRQRGKQQEMRLAIEEARRRLEAAEARQALRAEELRIAGLRAASGETSGKLGADVEMLDAELDAIEARIELARARGDLARAYFELEVNRGLAPAELVRDLAAVAGERDTK